MNNIDRLRKELPEENYCALVTSDINRRYLSGMKSSAGTVLVFPDAAYLLIDFRYYEKASETVTVCETVLMKKYYEQLRELLEKHKPDKIYIEASAMTVSELETYREKLEGFSVCCDKTLSAAIEKIRSVKTEDELEKMRKAQAIADAAFAFVTDNIIEEGVTERELALALDFYMLNHGAESVSFETIALCGENTSLPHGVPGDRKIKKGEFVLMDLGAVYEGYHSDMTRTVALGEPSEEMKEVYGIVLEAHNRCIDFAKEGVSCKALDACARDFIKEKGYGESFGHGLGHSVGMEIHESPAANTRDETILSAGMIMTVEPGIYLPKKFGVRIEDCGCIGKSGYDSFVTSPKKLVIL